MSDLNDPRVLFAAERTLMAWSRTAAGLMAFGFLIDRSSVLLPGATGRTGLGLGLGLAFVLLGVALCALSIAQYRRVVADLRPVEIPVGYWVNLAVYAAAVTGLLGFGLVVHLLAS